MPRVKLLQRVIAPPRWVYVNAPLNWGGTQWSAYMWANFPNSDAQTRGRLLIHELFHRVQPELKLMAIAGPNDHLDTLTGRYWLQLEWRALSRAINGSGEARVAALRDALAFRQKRRLNFQTAGANERADEIREGLAQYTGVVMAASNREDAVADAVRLLAQAEKDPTFVRTFAYASGPAYGLLLDDASPGWTRRVTVTDDLGLLVNAGATPIPNEGTVVFGFRATTDWGSIEVTNGVLVGANGDTIRLATPFQTDGTTLTGHGWTVKLAPGWVLRPAPRAGDLQIIRDNN